MLYYKKFVTFFNIFLKCIINRHNRVIKSFCDIIISMEKQYILALLITILAGLSTLVGGFSTFFIKKDSLKALSIGLGFSGGMMIYISLNELLIEANKYLLPQFNKRASLIAFLMFFIGVLIAIIIDYFIPDHIESDLFLKNPSECDCRMHKIKRAGIFTAVAVAIHNFPEGIANFFVSSQDLSLGIPLALAIAIHNIPEGIAVALPIYHAVQKKRVAIFYTFLSGIAEPIGALLGYFFLRNYLNETTLGFLFATISGIMVYISIDTLLPMAREYGENHHVVLGVMLGMFVIGLSLVLF